jgi:2-dehydropantoate 2-reductase
MRIVVLGAGGLGGYFGARLAAAGNDVAFVARGAHLAAIREHGLVVESARGDLHLREVVATDDPASLAPADIVLFTVKLWDTETAAETVKPLLRPGTGVISFQNGVHKEAVLSRILGADAVIGGTAQIGVAIARPGVLAHVGTMARLTFGELDGKPSARTQAFYDACVAAGIDTELTDDINLKLWEKFVFLIAMAGATASMRSRLGPIRANPQTRAFLIDLMREADAVGRALGVALPANYLETRTKAIEALPAEMTASMQGDLSRGNKLEVRWLNGKVVELGAQVGVPTPLNRAVCDVLALYADGAPTG